MHWQCAMLCPVSMPSANPIHPSSGAGADLALSLAVRSAACGYDIRHIRLRHMAHAHMHTARARARVTPKLYSCCVCKHAKESKKRRKIREKNKRGETAPLSSSSSSRRRLIVVRSLSLVVHSASLSSARPTLLLLCCESGCPTGSPISSSRSARCNETPRPPAPAPIVLLRCGKAHGILHPPRSATDSTTTNPPLARSPGRSRSLRQAAPLPLLTAGIG
jgi:hypothetical protein